MEKNVSFKQLCIVSCGTLNGELERLRETGFLDAGDILYTAPGLHEWPWKLEEQLPQRLKKAREISEHVLVVYGKRCFIDLKDAARMTDALIQEHCEGAVRIDAADCVDMLVSLKEREEIAGGEKIHWLTPGWLKNRKFIFKDWDHGKANEMFPRHTKAVVLDGIGYMDRAMAESPEDILEFSDWMNLPLEPHPITLDRIQQLLIEGLKNLISQDG